MSSSDEVAATFRRRFGIDDLLQRVPPRRMPTSPANKSKEMTSVQFSWFEGIFSPQPFPPTPPHSEFRSIPLRTPNSAISKRGRHGKTPVLQQRLFSEKRVHFSQQCLEGETQVEFQGETQLFDEGDTVVHEESTLVERYDSADDSADNSSEGGEEDEISSDEKAPEWLSVRPVSPSDSPFSSPEASAMLTSFHDDLITQPVEDRTKGNKPNLSPIRTPLKASTSPFLEANRDSGRVLSTSPKLHSSDYDSSVTRLHSPCSDENEGHDDDAKEETRDGNSNSNISCDLSPVLDVQASQAAATARRGDTDLAAALTPPPCSPSSSPHSPALTAPRHGGRMNSQSSSSSASDSFRHSTATPATSTQAPRLSPPPTTCRRGGGGGAQFQSPMQQLLSCSPAWSDGDDDDGDKENQGRGSSDTDKDTTKKIGYREGKKLLSSLSPVLRRRSSVSLCQVNTPLLSLSSQMCRALQLSSQQKQQQRRRLSQGWQVSTASSSSSSKAAALGASSRRSRAKVDTQQKGNSEHNRGGGNGCGDGAEFESWPPSPAGQNHDKNGKVVSSPLSAVSSPESALTPPPHRRHRHRDRGSNDGGGGGGGDEGGSFFAIAAPARSSGKKKKKKQQKEGGENKSRRNEATKAAKGKPRPAAASYPPLSMLSSQRSPNKTMSRTAQGSSPPAADGAWQHSDDDDDDDDDVDEKSEEKSVVVDPMTWVARRDKDNNHKNGDDNDGDDNDGDDFEETATAAAAAVVSTVRGGVVVHSDCWEAASECLRTQFRKAQHTAKGMAQASSAQRSASSRRGTVGACRPRRGSSSSSGSGGQGSAAVASSSGGGLLCLDRERTLVVGSRATIGKWAEVLAEESPHLQVLNISGRRLPPRLNQVLEHDVVLCTLETLSRHRSADPWGGDQGSEEWHARSRCRGGGGGGDGGGGGGGGGSGGGGAHHAHTESPCWSSSSSSQQQRKRGSGQCESGTLSATNRFRNSVSGEKALTSSSLRTAPGPLALRACHSVLHRIVWGRLVIDDAHSVLRLPPTTRTPRGPCPPAAASSSSSSSSTGFSTSVLRGSGTKAGVSTSAAAKAKAEALGLLRARRRWCVLEAARAPKLWRTREHLRALLDAVHAPQEASLVRLVPALVLELNE